MGTAGRQHLGIAQRVEGTINPAHFMSVLDVMVDDDIRDAMLQLPEDTGPAELCIVPYDAKKAAYSNNMDHNATDLVGTVKVNF